MLSNNSKSYFYCVKNWIIELLKETWNEAKKRVPKFHTLTWREKISFAFVFLRVFVEISLSFAYPVFFIIVILLRSIFVLLKAYKDYQYKNVFYNQINWKNYNKGNFLSKTCFWILYTNSLFYKIFFCKPKFIEIKMIAQLVLRICLSRIIFFSATPNEAFWFCLCYYGIYLVNLQTIIQFKKIKKETWEYFYTVLWQDSFFKLTGFFNKQTENQYHDENLTKGFFCFILLFGFFRIVILIPVFWLIIKKLVYSWIL